MKRFFTLTLALILLTAALPAYAEEWICVSCGAENSGNFCGRCGTSREAWKCASCGEINTQYFCTNCGRSKPDQPKQTTVPASVQTAIVASGQCGDNVYWELDKDGVLTLSGKGPTYEYSFLNAPFLNNYSKIVKKVIIQEGITKLSQHLFNSMKSIERLVIPDTVKRMEIGAFSDCKNLRSVVLSKNIQVDQENDTMWFKGCANLEQVTIPEGLTDLGSYLFYDCSSLTQIVLPASIETIRNNVFRGIDHLERVTFKADRIHFDNFAFFDFPTPITFCFSAPVKEFTSQKNSFYKSNIQCVEGVPSGATELFAKSIGAKYVEIGAAAGSKPLTTAKPAATPKPAPTPKPTATASLEERFQEALESLNCFERIRTDLMAVLGPMDIYGTDYQSHKSNTCLNIIDLVGQTVTVTGISSDGTWYNAIWLNLTEDEVLAAVSVCATNYEFHCKGLRENIGYVMALKSEDDNYLYIDSVEDAENLMKLLTR